MSRVVEVEEDTVLLEAIRRAGIRIRCICGGEGECGTCRVILEKGEVRDISFKYERLLSAEEIAEGYRLACQIRVESDCEFTIPVESRIHSPKILISTKIGIEKIDPAARKHLVTSVPAEIEEKRSIDRCSKYLVLWCISYGRLNKVRGQSHTNNFGNLLTRDVASVTENRTLIKFLNRCIGYFCFSTTVDSLFEVV